MRMILPLTNLLTSHVLCLPQAQCNALKRLCFNEGIDEAKIDQIMMVEECVVSKYTIFFTFTKNRRKVKQSSKYKFQYIIYATFAL